MATNNTIIEISTRVLLLARNHGLLQLADKRIRLII